jgi:acetyl-CoA C-acetyltransferase
MPEAVIVATARTPIGRAVKGSLANVRPDDLAAFIVADVLGKVPALDPAEVEDLLLGCAQPAGESGYNLARVVSILAGLPDVPGATINRYCSSSLQAIRSAGHAIKAGEGDVFIGAGVETVSRFGNGKADGGPTNPRFDDARARSAALNEEGSPAWTPAEGLPDVYVGMGLTAENVADVAGVTREDMDEFAALSQQRATASLERGFWEDEITPYPTTDADGNDIVVRQDDGIRPGTTAEGLGKLKPVFRADGRVTAGNACPLNDGAAAVIVMSDTRAAELGLTPLARIVSSAVSALDPEIMGLGPVEASRRALARAGLTMDDIDLVEMNEAFAAQVVPSARELGISYDKLNVNGGAIAIGHPFGMTGARIMTTLIHGLQDADKTFGLETMCVGGGQGMAMVIERLS